MFINQIEDMLSYRIHELKKQDNGYYKLEHNYSINKKNYRDYQENTYNKYCYVITPENRILESIYPDKVVILKGVVDNLYEMKSMQNTIKKTPSKKFVKKI